MVTSQLQTPTAYGTGTSIFKDWNVNVDGKTGNDDPWDFGTANQYPALKFGAHAAADQRAAVTLSLSPDTIWESNTGSSTRATTSTLTATLDRAWNQNVAVTVPTNAAYTSSATTITIAAGATTGTATLTAVNNFLCGTAPARRRRSTTPSPSPRPPTPPTPNGLSRAPTFPSPSTTTTNSPSPPPPNSPSTAPISRPTGPP